jgi:hypothetical protein
MVRLIERAHHRQHEKSYYPFVWGQLTPVKDDLDEVLKEVDFLREELLFGKLKIGNIAN